MDMVYPLNASFTSKARGSWGRCELTGMSVKYCEIVKIVLVDPEDEIRVKTKLVRLRFELEEFKRFVERFFCVALPNSLYTLNYHLLGHLVKNLEMFGTLFQRREAI